MGATTMSDYIEMLNPQTMTATLLKSGEVIATYKVEQCDKCGLFARLDEFGYQKGQGGEKLIWFCGGCR
jgi:hypothetical protein